MPAQYPGNSATKAARAKAGGGFESAIEVAAFTPLVTENYLNGTVGELNTDYRRCEYTDVQSLSGGIALKMTHVANFPPPNNPTEGFVYYHADRRPLPVTVTEGYTIWQRVFFYFPSTYSFGYTYGQRDSTTMAASASSGATSISVNPTATVPLADGMPVYVYLDDGSEHFTYINGGADVVGGQINLLDALPSAASAGNDVDTYDEAEAKYANTQSPSTISGDGNNRGQKWLQLGPDVGSATLYANIPSERRQIQQSVDSKIWLLNEVDSSLGSADVVLPTDEWVCLQQGAKIASDGTGWMRFWVNGELKVEKLNVQTLSASATGINEWGSGSYKNGGHWSDGQPGRLDYYWDEAIVATDMPGYGTPTGVDNVGNAFIDPVTRVGDL